MNKKALVCLLLLWGIGAGIADASADKPYVPYKANGSIRILSQYDQNGSGSNRLQEIEWWVTSSEVDNTEWMLEFVMGTGNGKGNKSICTVSMGVSEICWRANGYHQDRCIRAGELLINRGFPAPCDILPFDTMDHGSQKEFVSQSEAGGRSFEWRYILKKEELSRKEAEEAGYLKIDAISETTFEMVTVIDASGILVERQIWPQNSEWWVYEETPVRRSWRLNAADSPKGLD